MLNVLYHVIGDPPLLFQSNGANSMALLVLLSFDMDSMSSFRYTSLKTPLTYTAEDLIAH